MKKITLSIMTMAAVLTAGIVSCSKTNVEKPAAKTETTATAATTEVAKPAEEKKVELPEIALKNINGIYISANDLTVGNVVAEVKAEDGFVLNASEEKAMAVEQPAEALVAGADVFSNRLSTKGSGNTEVRNVTFPAKAGDSIVIWAAQGGSSNRPLHVVNAASGDEVAELSMLPKDGKTIVLNVFEVKAPADGSYCVYSTSGGCYIYQIKVGKPE